MTNYIFHTTGSNERWDNIAYQYYKDSYNIQPIIDANPHISINTRLQEGIILKIPIEEKSETTNKKLLPIWKRNSVE